jgi:hypothetical protein
LFLPTELNPFRLHFFLLLWYLLCLLDFLCDIFIYWWLIYYLLNISKYHSHIFKSEWSLQWLIFIFILIYKLFSYFNLCFKLLNLVLLLDFFEKMGLFLIFFFFFQYIIKFYIIFSPANLLMTFSWWGLFNLLLLLIWNGLT